MTPMDLDQNNDPQMTPMPAGPMGANKPTKPMKSFPEITIHHRNAHKIPKSGTAKVKFHLAEKKTSMKGGKAHHSARIQLHSFAPMGSAPAPSDEEALESALQEQQEGGDDTQGQ